MLGSSEILAGCIEELKYPFVSSHSCYVGKGMLVVFGNGSEGSTGRCATGKSTPHLVEAPSTHAGRSVVYRTHFDMIPNAYVKGKIKI